MFWKPQMNTLYLETLTLEVLFRYVISFSAAKIFSVCFHLFTLFSARSSHHSRRACKKGVLKNFVNVTGNHLCCSLLLIKLQAWHLFWRTSLNNCFWAVLAPLAVTYAFYFIFSTYRSSHLRCSVKKGVLRNFAKALQFYLNRDSGTGVFLWILQSF